MLAESSDLSYRYQEFATQIVSDEEEFEIKKILKKKFVRYWNEFDDGDGNSDNERNHR